jgi:NAD(P)-dependent dehydrogenase (short-subunit alcohol dehydrogenase family)
LPHKNQKSIAGVISYAFTLGRFKTSFASTLSLGRVGSPDEVAKDASFLASDDRRLFDENFAAALALLDVPQFQQYESGLSSWQR